jgi:uncharacterized protein YjbJ (UPF0337 family)
MNTLELKGNWNVIKGKLKQQYADLTDNDLIYDDGAQDEIIGRLQVKLGKTKQEVLDILEKAKQITF